MKTLDKLNALYGIRSHLEFLEGADGLVLMRVNNAFAEAEIYLQGAHITKFKPHHQNDILWLSEDVVFKSGKAIRGGIPICWPWFGNHPEDNDLPAHGFVRNRFWQVTHTQNDEHGTQIVLQFKSDEETKTLWPHDFRLELTIRIGSELSVSMQTHNTGTSSLNYTAALHSYFPVADIRHASISGLDGCTYIDTVGDEMEKTQKGEIRFESEVDNIYMNTTATCVINDSKGERDIVVSKSGSHSTVVWNPWIDKAARLSDFNDTGYLNMVCVETANARSHSVEINPGASHQMGCIISTTPTKC